MARGVGVVVVAGRGFFGGGSAVEEAPVGRMF